MIFSYGDEVVLDGCPQELCVGIMNILRVFIQYIPDTYRKEWIIRFMLDLQNPNSYLYVDSKDINNHTYWFETLHCESCEDDNDGI